MNFPHPKTSVLVVDDEELIKIVGIVKEAAAARSAAAGPSSAGLTPRRA
jgi:hypothetical protein